MKRIYFIANAYDGAYFALSDDIEEFFQKVASYVINLQRSHKLNNYSFGSVEMTEKEYLDAKSKAENWESDCIADQESEEKADHSKPTLEVTENEEDERDESGYENVPIPVKARKRDHLRLV